METRYLAASTVKSLILMFCPPKSVILFKEISINAKNSSYLHFYQWICPIDAGTKPSPLHWWFGGSWQTSPSFSLYRSSLEGRHLCLQGVFPVFEEKGLKAKQSLDWNWLLCGQNWNGRKGNALSHAAICAGAMHLHPLMSRRRVRIWTCTRSP